MIFRLKKPDYYRPQGAHGANFHYLLGPEVKDWLADHQAIHHLWNEDYVEGGQTFIGCYLRILDPLAARMFKLAWPASQLVN